MPAFTVKILGQDKLARRLRAIGVDSQKAVRQAIAVSAVQVEGEAKRSIQQAPRGGDRYVRYSPRREGKASAAGEPPATDLGTLVQNITHVVDADGLGASVESRANYSAALEFGTTKMAARPFMHPAFERHQVKIIERIGDAVRQALGRSTIVGEAAE